MITVLIFGSGLQYRRAFLRGVALVGGAGFIAAATVASSAGACKVVDGDIAPGGGYDFYGLKV